MSGEKDEFPLRLSEMDDTNVTTDQHMWKAVLTLVFPRRSFLYFLQQRKHVAERAANFIG